ncbi:hypothetical protein D3C81_2057460 [compost metagenome]
MAMNAGKLAKPRVAIATPPTLTAMKKVTQWAASRAPVRPSTGKLRRVSASSRRVPLSPATKPRAMKAKVARPKVMMLASALIK